MTQAVPVLHRVQGWRRPAGSLSPGPCAWDAVEARAELDVARYHVFQPQLKG
jgi:hypothetical protein